MSENLTTILKKWLNIQILYLYNNMAMIAEDFLIV